MLNLEELQRESARTGFPAETLEKVLRLLGLLNALRAHPFLGPRVALKGGTALNLFLFDVPRLSVDIDLNYVGSADREVMLAERPKLEEALRAVCGREGLALKRAPDDHAGGKWRLGYRAASGQPGNLEVDVNYLLRVPLWPPVTRDSREIALQRAERIRILDVHELAAGKLVALLARTASRDLFDARELLRLPDLDPAKLRLAFVVYGAGSRKDWRTVSVHDVAVDAAEIRRQLVPVLRGTAAPGAAELPSWADALVSECRRLLAAVLPLTEAEREFVSRLNQEGEIVPELLTDDEAMRRTLREHPALRWKAMNVRQHRGRVGRE